MNYLDRNEFNYAPSQEVVEALKNFLSSTYKCNFLGADNKQ